MVVYATPGTKLRKRLAAAQAKGKTLVAGPAHALSRAAFKQQQ